MCPNRSFLFIYHDFTEHRGLDFAFFEAFGVFSHNQVVDAVLDVAVHECGKVIDGIADAVVGDAPLRIVVGANLGAAVAG